jgi:hypothetical protein
MKLSRFLALGAGVALVGASALLAGGAASAKGGVSNPGNVVVYNTATSFPAETAPYPAGFFLGTIAAPGSVTRTAASGLAISGAVQLLNGTPGSIANGGLSAVVDAAGLGVVSGDANFQISLFENGSSDFTTLHPLTDGDAGLDSTIPWATSQAIPADPTGSNIAYAAGSTATLAEFEAALGTDDTILAFGVIVPVGHVAVISSITWNGTSYRFNTATATPTGTVSPSTVSVTDFAAAGKGVTGVFAGFIPGETIDEIFTTAGNGGPTGVTAVADATGAVSFPYVESDPARDVAGAYRLGAQGEASGVVVTTAFTVSADATATPVLATTGANPAPLLATGGTLLLAGLAFGVVSLRRRNTRRA